MQVSTSFIHGYSVRDWAELTTYAIECERIGVASIWSPEGWGYDGATPLAYLAAKTSTIGLGTSILQVGTRTPTNLAMTAMSLYSMSNGRFKLGLGTSGPQVIEGFHGVLFDHPVARTRETIEILKQVFSGERVAYQGKFFQLPVREGQGKPLAIAAPPAPEIPIYIAALGPRNLQLTGELADGWRGTSFMPEHADAFFSHIAEGAKKAGRSIKDLDLQAPGTVWFTDEVDDAVAATKPAMAYQLGAMGSREFNFYNNAYSRAGYADVAKEIQELWLAGRRDDARALVPDDIILKTHFIGTDEMIKKRIRVHRDAGVTTLSATLRARDPETSRLTVKHRIEILERFIDLVRQVSAEPEPAGRPA